MADSSTIFKALNPSPNHSVACLSPPLPGVYNDFISLAFFYFQLYIHITLFPPEQEFLFSHSLLTYFGQYHNFPAILYIFKFLPPVDAAKVFTANIYTFPNIICFQNYFFISIFFLLFFHDLGKYYFLDFMFFYVVETFYKQNLK